MATWDNGVGQASHDGSAVGRDLAFAAIADVVRFEDEILDDEVFVALELGPRWDLRDALTMTSSWMVSSAVLARLSDPGRF